MSLKILYGFDREKKFIVPNNIFSIFILIFLVGCNIRSSFQPPRYTYELYRKEGASKIEVMKALLECGMEDPIGG